MLIRFSRIRLHHLNMYEMNQRAKVPLERRRLANNPLQNPRRKNIWLWMSSLAACCSVGSVLITISRTPRISRTALNQQSFQGRQASTRKKLSSWVKLWIQVKHIDWENIEGAWCAYKSDRKEVNWQNIASRFSTRSKIHFRFEIVIERMICLFTCIILNQTSLRFLKISTQIQHKLSH